MAVGQYRREKGRREEAKWGQSPCIDCGEITSRELPERFPHICHHCLFPTAQVYEAENQFDRSVNPRIDRNRQSPREAAA